jgi:hypothetical protein
MRGLLSVSRIDRNARLANPICGTMAALAPREEITGHAALPAANVLPIVGTADL